MLSIVIPVHNQLPLIKDIYYQLIYSSAWLSDDIIFVDDNSTDWTTQRLKSRKWFNEYITILENSKRNRLHLIWSINLWVREAKNNKVMIMKPNIRIDTETIIALDEWLKHSKISHPSYQRWMSDRIFYESDKILEQCFAIRKSTWLFPIGDKLLNNYLWEWLFNASKWNAVCVGMIRIVEDIKASIVDNNLMYRAMQKDWKTRDLIKHKNKWK